MTTIERRWGTDFHGFYSSSTSPPWNEKNGHNQVRDVDVALVPEADEDGEGDDQGDEGQGVPDAVDVDGVVVAHIGRVVAVAALGLGHDDDRVAVVIIGFGCPLPIWSTASSGIIWKINKRMFGNYAFVYKLIPDI